MLRPKPRPCTAPVPPHAYHYGRPSHHDQHGRPSHHDHHGRPSHHDQHGRSSNDDAVSSQGESPRPRKNKNVADDVFVEGSLHASKGFFTEEIRAASACTSGHLRVGGGAEIEGSTVLRGKTYATNAVVVEDDLKVCGNTTMERKLTIHDNLTVENTGALKLECPLESSSFASFEKQIFTQGDANIEGCLHVGGAAGICADLRVDGNVDVGDTLHCGNNICACGMIVSKSLDTSCSVKTDKIHSRLWIQKQTPLQAQVSVHPPDSQCCIISSSISAILFELYLNSPELATEPTQYSVLFNLGCVCPWITAGVCALGFDSASGLKQDAFSKYTSSVKIQDGQAVACVDLTKKNDQDDQQGESDMVRLSFIVSWVG